MFTSDSATKCTTDSITIQRELFIENASASRATDLWFDSCFLHGDFSRSSNNSDLKIGPPVATLPDT